MRARGWLALCVLLAIHPAYAAPKALEPRSALTLTWLGHAAFEIVSPGGTRLLIDPWLRENTTAPAAWRSLQALADHAPTAILLTHAHEDHAADVPEIASRTHAAVVATGELLRALKIPEPQQRAINVGGGAVRIGDVEVFGVPAMHSSEPGGRPLGFVIRCGGHTIYDSGDTWIFGDMQLIEDVYHPDVLLMEAGGAMWGLDPRTAALAVRRYFHPRWIVPMHFGTYEPLDPESAVRAAFAGDRRVRFLTPGVPFVP